MLRQLIFLAAVCAVLGDGFAKKFGFSKAMTSCLGDDVYYGWRNHVFQAMMACSVEETVLPQHEEQDASEESGTDYTEQPLLLSLNHKEKIQEVIVTSTQPPEHEAVFSAPVLKQMAAKVEAKLGNITCVLKKLNYLEEDFDVNYDFLREELRTSVLFETLDDSVKADLIAALDYCEEYMKSAPPENPDSPMPKKLQDMLGFLKCERRTRLHVCMKYDFIKNLGDYDLSGFRKEGEGNAQMAEKLIHLTWGLEADDELQLY
ncbi:uncharacterized protein LOC122263540 [Penaeus japonicus]|uniref:uncharacterized protein LOC122263540 n=1 Tax=Penaeus japonicus TaxID=27405 RepID=UPI001C70C12E|nr:uncharacterized protein LOC122263540 [Penaeus japonicus]